MVGERRVVVLDDDGRPIPRGASLRQLNSFAEGPCPVLEAFVAATAAGAQAEARSVQPQAHSTPRAEQLGKANRSASFRPVLRMLARARENIRR